MNIHEGINQKLTNFINNKNIPNILFHGPSGCGKKYIINNFINTIYNNNRDYIKLYVMRVNCAKDGGIKFIREDIKFFSKTNINCNIKNKFKSIILLNADKLTGDAQSALRRCIEIFSFNTRFFLVTNDKYKILKPILSRFCELYIPYPIINNTAVNLYTYNLKNTMNLSNIKKDRQVWLKKFLNNITITTLKDDIDKLYNKAYNAIDIIDLYKINPLNNNATINDLLISFSKIKREFRNEKLLMYFIVYFIYFRSDYNLENIVFI
jgi:DNA polymerase III delta prime subunit